MGNKLFIGNLPFSATDASLESLFSQAGKVTSAKIVTDRETGRSRGFGFVEMASPEDAEACIEKFNGKDFDGRAMNVSEAKPQAPRERSFGGGGGGGYGGGGRGGRY